MLHSMTKAGTNAHFTYDHTGLRIKKTVNGVDTKYTLNGKKITHIHKGSTQMHFFYDAQGKASIIRYNGVDYAYLHNLQGDVMGIIDMSGALVVQYSYDAWGKAGAVTGSFAATLGNDNPFRYRGYVWDEETGLYYLRSRYYNPQWGRFLNTDTYLGKIGEILSENVFAYCNNNPANLRDPAGSFPLLALVVAVVIPIIAVVIAPIKKKRENYSNTVQGLDVENDLRYRKDEKGNTFCNRFVYDLMWKLGAPMPSHKGKKGDAPYVSDMLNRLLGFKTKAGKWVEITGPFALQNAWLHAQLGIPTISIWRCPEGDEGHAQAARPGSFDESWAQAGGSSGNYSAGPHMSRQDPDTHAGGACEKGGTHGGEYRYFYFDFN